MGGRYGILLEKTKPPAPQAAVPLPVKQPQITGTTQSIEEKTPQSIRKFTRQSTKQSTNTSDNGTVDRPKGFYITHRLDQRLDTAVQYLQEKHGIKKVDRSLILNAMLDTDERWTDEALEALVDPILSILTSRLIR